MTTIERLQEFMEDEEIDRLLHQHDRYALQGMVVAVGRRIEDGLYCWYVYVRHVADPCWKEPEKKPTQFLSLEWALKRAKEIVEELNEQA